MNSILYLVRKLPGTLANETIDMVLVSGVFGQPTTVVFMDDGVFQLIGDGEKIRRKDTAKKWTALPAYDIDKVLVHLPSLAERNIPDTQLPNFVCLASDSELQDAFREANCVVSD
ncbi:MAG: DsrE family protein [Gammaproteobacteria bacterium]|nr:DsrE family protein [Gammaproteobacteria bacterium]